MCLYISCQYGISGKVYLHVHYPVTSPGMFRSLAGDKRQLATYVHTSGVIPKAELISIADIHDIADRYALLRGAYGQAMQNV
jgi:hypothetical protein